MSSNVRSDSQFNRKASSCRVMYLAFRKSPLPVHAPVFPPPVPFAGRAGDVHICRQKTNLKRRSSFLALSEALKTSLTKDHSPQYLRRVDAHSDAGSRVYSDNYGSRSSHRRSPQDSCRQVQHSVTVNLTTTFPFFARIIRKTLKPCALAGE